MPDYGGSSKKLNGFNNGRDRTDGIGGNPPFYEMKIGPAKVKIKCTNCDGTGTTSHEANSPYERECKRCENGYIYKEVEEMNEYGYHKKKIEKGKLGEYSKIKEEFEELSDAVEQKNKILILCELSDLIGSIEEYAKSFGMSLDDIKQFSDLTKKAFKDGIR